MTLLSSNIKFKPYTIYLVSRGTKEKSGLIAEKFNLNDKFSTHLGLGFFYNEKLTIYNVTDRKPKDQTALIIDSLETFVIENASYLSVWECKNNDEEFLKGLKLCRELYSKKISFDYTFDISNEKKSYCSKFCNTILREMNSKKFDFEATSIELNEFYRKVLKKKNLIYYPIDFFQNNKYFKKIYEKKPHQPAFIEQ